MNETVNNLGMKALEEIVDSNMSLAIVICLGLTFIIAFILIRRYEVKNEKNYS